MEILLYSGNLSIHIGGRRSLAFINIMIIVSISRLSEHGLLSLTTLINPQFFLELITTQLRFYMVSPQLSLLTLINIGLRTKMQILKLDQSP